MLVRSCSRRLATRERGAWAAYAAAALQDAVRLNAVTPRELEVALARLAIGERLGAGSFGTVHAVTLDGERLALNFSDATQAIAARFKTPAGNIGLCCSTPMVAIARNMSPKHAMEMLLTGDLIPAARAEEMGLVNRVVAKADLRDATDALAADADRARARVGE